MARRAGQARAIGGGIGVVIAGIKIGRRAHRVGARQFQPARFGRACHLVVAAKAAGTGGGSAVKFDQIVDFGVEHRCLDGCQRTVGFLDAQLQAAALLGAEIGIAVYAEPLIERGGAKAGACHGAERQILTRAPDSGKAACGFATKGGVVVIPQGC